MAEERIQVIEDFLESNTVNMKLKRMALGNAYYMAARISFFDSNIPAKKYLLMAFKNRKGWVENAKFHEIIYILLLPIARLLNPSVNYFFDKFGRSNYGT
jgi:hypothetical protein